LGLFFWQSNECPVKIVNPFRKEAIANTPINKVKDYTEVISLLAEYQSVYDEIVQPDPVIVVPGYFLRFIPLLGPELSWLYIGFRQAAYEAEVSKKPGKKVGAPAKKVAWFAGMSPRSLREVMGFGIQSAMLSAA
jgi:hypothetical protein